MRHKNSGIIGLIIIACLSISNCERSQTTTNNEEKPAIVEGGGGTRPTRVTLSAEAAKRIDVQTVPVSEVPIQGIPHKVIPYSSIIYDNQGQAWAYINPKPLTFVRVPVQIDTIAGEQAILTDGPPPGTQVVSVGVSELYGTEYQGIIEP